MTELYIDGKLAAFKQGTSFDFISENRLFTESDAFSMSIELPMRGCQQNRLIYGNITRRDIAKAKIINPAILRCGQWERKGNVTVIDVDEVSVKVQFLEGQAAANYDSALNLYINEIDLPYPSNSTSPTEAAALKMANEDIDDDAIFLTLPWVNAYSGNLQNELDLRTLRPQSENPGCNYYAFAGGQYLSHQIYMLPLVRKILNAAGYTSELMLWQTHPRWRYLLVWNTLPAQWQERNYNKALPHWTILELLEQISHLLGVDFVIDEAKKTITMRSYAAMFTNPVIINNPIDEYTASISDEFSPFRCNKVGVYADNGSKDWPMLSCVEQLNDYINSGKYVITSYDELDAWPLMIGTVYQYAYLVLERIFKAKDTGAYLTSKMACGYLPSGASAPNFAYVMMGMRINSFGNQRKGEGEEFELKIVPARIEDYTLDAATYQTNTSHHAVTLDCGTYEEKKSRVPQTIDEAIAEQGGAERLLRSGETKSTEYFDKIYVGYWKKQFCHTIYEGSSARSITDAPDRNYNQLPVVDQWKVPKLGWINMADASTRAGMTETGFTLARNEYEAGLPRVSSTKVTVRWLAKEIPEVTNVFIIDNQRYLCERIKATFTEDGMSELLEGDFYALL